MNGVFQIECVILQSIFIKFLNEKNYRSRKSKSKKVLLRLDLNVPLKNGSITDETRINKIIPVINFLIQKNQKF